jgi:EpsI family protein
MAVRALILLVILSLSGGYAHQLRGNRVHAGSIPDLSELPTTTSGWSSKDFELSETVLAVLDPDAVLQRLYRHRDGSEVWLFVAYFAEQQINSQIHSPRQCIPGSGWTVVSTDQHSLTLPRRTQTATRMVLERDDTSHELWYWFDTRGGSVAGEYALKWDLVKNSLARRPTDAAFVRYVASEDNVDAMHELMKELDAPLHEILAAVGLP